MKNKFGTILILIATVALAGIAIFTAVRLYKLRETSVAPNAPGSVPKAVGQACSEIQSCPAGEVCIYENGSTNPPYKGAQGTCQIATTATPTPASGACNLSFTLSSATATPSSIKCGDACDVNSKFNIQCGSEYTCYNGVCRDPSCPTDTDCLCEGETPTPTPTQTATPTPTPTVTITATPTGAPNDCGGTCGSNSNCSSTLFCYQGFCRNPSCPSKSDCLCGTAAPTGTGISYVTATPRPTQEAELPEAGTSLPTILGIGIGTLLLIISLALAL